jgi:cell division protein FtsA
MIQKDELIASIDIGSSKIKCLIAKLHNNKIEIIGKSIVASKGISKGLVANFQEANSAVRECLEIAEKQAGVSLNKIIVNAEFENIISSILTEYKSVHGEPIEHEKDIQGLIHVAVDEISKNNKDKGILHIFSSNYKIDKKINVENPIGFKANTFSTDIHAVLADHSSIDNLKNIINSCELSVENYIFGAYALGLSFLTTQDLSESIICIDFGKDKTSFSIFENNTLSYVGVVPFGSNHISKDLAKVLDIKLEVADRIKIESGDCLLNENIKDKLEYLPVHLFPDDDYRKISKTMVNTIINSRVEEILQLVYRKIKSYNLIDIKSKKIYLSGRGSNLAGLLSLVRRYFSKRAELVLQKKHEDQNLINNLSQDFLICYGIIKNYFYGFSSEALPIKFKNTGFFSTLLSIFQK